MPRTQLTCQPRERTRLATRKLPFFFYKVDNQGKNKHHVKTWQCTHLNSDPTHKESKARKQNACETPLESFTSDRVFPAKGWKFQ